MSALTSGSLFSIGEVISQLRAEFPEVSVTKVRFLEAEGLVDPARTPSGYRKFTEEHVERLRYILRAQRDYYLPLKVIKEQLEALDRGEVSASELLGTSSPGEDRPSEAEPHDLERNGTGRVAANPQPSRGHMSLVGPGAAPTGEDFVPSGSDVRMNKREFLAAAGIDRDLLDELESHSLVVPAMGTGFYDADALAVATAVSALGAYGIAPRHLRALRNAADRQIDLVTQVVTPQSRQGTAGSGKAEESARELTALLLGLQVAMLRAGLARELGH